MVPMVVIILELTCYTDIHYYQTKVDAMMFRLKDHHITIILV